MAGVATVERRPGPAQQALDRGLAGIQHGRNLQGGEFENLPQPQRRGLPGRQVLQRFDEREFHGLARLVDAGCVARGQAAEEPDLL